MSASTNRNAFQFADLLSRAVSEPGTVSQAYLAFHTYSIGNQLLALAQCMARGIQAGPLATYQRWRELGRYVRKGEKASCFVARSQSSAARRPTTARRGPESLTFFVYKAYWFTLSQTEGADLPPLQIPTWDRTRALAALNVREIPFDVTDGNVLGFARKREIAVSPLNPLPHKTTLHELAHVLLGHTAEADLNDDERTPRNLRECEAEAVALLCCAALDLPGVEGARGYIQTWWGKGNPIPERSAQRVLKVADQILKAGLAEHAEQGAA